MLCADALRGRFARTLCADALRGRFARTLCADALRGRFARTLCADSKSPLTSGAVAQEIYFRPPAPQKYLARIRRFISTDISRLEIKKIFRRNKKIYFNRYISVGNKKDFSRNKKIYFNRYISVRSGKYIGRNKSSYFLLFSRSSFPTLQLLAAP